MCVRALDEGIASYAANVAIEPPTAQLGFSHIFVFI